MRSLYHIGIVVVVVAIVDQVLCWKLAHVEVHEEYSGADGEDDDNGDGHGDTQWTK